MLAAWWARKPNYGHVKMARLKRENAVSDVQIGDIGTREDNQTSDTWYGYLTPPPSPVHSGSGWQLSRNQCWISISYPMEISIIYSHSHIQDLFLHIQDLSTYPLIYITCNINEKVIQHLFTFTYPLLMLTYSRLIDISTYTLISRYEKDIQHLFTYTYPLLILTYSRLIVVTKVF